MEEVYRMSLTDKDLSYREIITKAVCGKGRKFSQVTHAITPPHKPTSVLGVWLINHQYEAVKSDDGIEVVGTYDINFWYSYDNNSQTEVAKETLSYVEAVPLSYLDRNHRKPTAEVFAETTQEPSCVEANIVTSGNAVRIKVEREFKVEMVAETKVCVLVNENGIDELDGEKDFDFDYDGGDFEDLDPDLLDDDI